MASKGGLGDMTIHGMPEGFRPPTIDEFHFVLLEDCKNRLAKLDKERDFDKEFHYEMIGEVNPDMEQRARNFELLGISRFHVRTHAIDQKAAEAQALADLLEGQKIRPLNNEATEILATLVAAKQEAERQSWREADASQEVQSKATSDKSKATSAKESDTASSKESETARSKESKPASVKESAGKLAKSETAGQRADSQPKKVASTVGSGLANAIAAENLLSAEAKPLELSINVEEQEGITIVTATPAQDVTVDAADGKIRFCLGERSWDVAVDGEATKVRRRKGRLEVTVEKNLDTPKKSLPKSDPAAFQPIAGIKTTYRILTDGEADSQFVKVGDRVTVHAKGSIKQTGKKFWSTKDPGQKPFTYSAGGEVITGWDKGALGMKMWEVRELLIPADEGYGAKGFPAWGIPPNSELFFELEVLDIKGKR